MPSLKIVIYSDRFLIRKGIECLLKDNFDIPILSVTDSKGLLKLKNDIDSYILILDKDVLDKDILNIFSNVENITTIVIGRPREEFIKVVDDFLPLRAEASYLINRLKYHIDRKISNNDITKAGEGKLTDREEEIVRLIALGYTSQQIADILSISPNTVVTHRKNITAKLGIKTISGLTIYAILNGLVSIDEVKDGLK